MIPPVSQIKFLNPKNLSSKPSVTSHRNAQRRWYSSGLFIYAISYIFTRSHRKKLHESNSNVTRYGGRKLLYKKNDLSCLDPVKLYSVVHALLTDCYWSPSLKSQL